MSTKKYPSIEYLRQCVWEENGKLFWLKRPREHFQTSHRCNNWNAKFAGNEAGGVSETRNGFRWKIAINNKKLYRYIVVWALNHGEWPTKEIDHKNRNSLDDKIGNLRLASDSQNLVNSRMHSNNTSGFKGIHWDKSRKRWLVSIGFQGKTILVGRFKSIDDARTARTEAFVRYYGEFAHDGT